jgi:hypothetical protein
LVPVQIYSCSITPRLQYACRILFECVLKVPYHIYIIEEKLPGAGADIFYTSQMPPNAKGLHIVPAGLLAETGLRQTKPSVKWEDDLPFLYFGGQEEEQSDLLSAAFYMATRYEEYLLFTPDAFGRFPEWESLSGQNDFTHLPIVHLWAIRLGKAIKEFYPDFTWPEKKAEAFFTYDIDVAYAYRGRSLFTHALSLAKDLVSGNFSNISRKFKTGFGKKNDPSDTYKLLINNQLQTLYFFLLTKNKTTYDRNLSPDSKVLQQLIRQIASTKTNVGIHPSYFSSEQPGLFASEKKELENIVNQPVTISRQHFLRFRLPGTFRQLLAAGIQHDYSMQYPEMPGFRAGLCVPFPFFDLLENKETTLMLHPGCIMETTFRDDLHLPAAKSRQLYLELWQQVQAVGGQFISIWHNDTLWEGMPDTHPLAFRQVHNQLVEIISAGSGSKSQSLTRS